MAESRRKSTTMHSFGQHLCDANVIHVPWVFLLTALYDNQRCCFWNIYILYLHMNVITATESVVCLESWSALFGWTTNFISPSLTLCNHAYSLSERWYYVPKVYLIFDIFVPRGNVCMGTSPTILGCHSCQDRFVKNYRVAWVVL